MLYGTDTLCTPRIQSYANNQSIGLFTRDCGAVDLCQAMQKLDATAAAMQQLADVGG